MFTRTAAFYDALYSWKDYAAEALRLRALMARHKTSDGNALLDVACGTGAHLAHLKGDFQVTGVDLDDEMLAAARARHPDVTFHAADMVDFDLGAQFDVVTCLFSSIGYTRTLFRMTQAVQAMARHLRPGGVLLVEPWFTPDRFIIDGKPRALFVDQPDLKIARMNISRIEDGVAVLEFHYLIAATGEGITSAVERHELGMFTDADYRGAFVAAGLPPLHDPDGLDGRGLYIGVKTP